MELFSLLQRTSKTNRFMRKDANEALESVAMHMPGPLAVRALNR
jgi:hypothetical protein